MCHQVTTAALLCGDGSSSYQWDFVNYKDMLKSDPQAKLGISLKINPSIPPTFSIIILVSEGPINVEADIEIALFTARI